MKRIFFLLFLEMFLIIFNAKSEKIQTNVIFDLIDNKESLSFYWKKDGNLIIDTLSLDLSINGKNIIWKIISKEEVKKKEDFSLNMGENKAINNQYTEIYYSLSPTNIDLVQNCKLCVRIYENDVVAYSWKLDHKTPIKVKEKATLYPSNRSGSIYSPNGEYEPLGPLSLSIKKKLNTPIIYECDNWILGIHEAGLYNYSQLFVLVENNKIELLPDVSLVDKEENLPWRVFFIGKNIADIHNKKSIYYGLNENSIGDFSWVKPGIAVWDWRVIGGTYSNYTYSNDKASLKRYIDFAAEQGLPYYQMDAAWNFTTDPITFFKEYGIQEIIEYAKTKNVGVWMYYDNTYVKNGVPEVDFETIASTYAAWGAVGIKYGFLNGKDTTYISQSKVSETERIINIAAKNKLMIIFHDNPIPFSGLERTYPNYVNREYCHSQMDRRTSFTPASFVKMVCVNMLAGFMDQTNGTFDIDNKTRKYGPKNDYNSTVSAEVARFFITYSGTYAMLLDAPEAYKVKLDLFEFIKSLPDKWDETRYLEMDFDSHVSVARKKNDTWFVGTVYNEKGGRHMLNLDFLQDGLYEMTLFADAENSHFMTNKEMYKVSKKIVKAGEKVNIYVAPGGGFSVILKKKI